MALTAEIGFYRDVWPPGGARGDLWPWDPGFWHLQRLWRLSQLLGFLSHLSGPRLSPLGLLAWAKGEEGSMVVAAD